MKTVSKIVFGLLTSVFLSCSLSAQAGNLSDIHSFKHALGGKANKLQAAYWTDVHVENLSSYPIIIKVPGSPFYDVLDTNLVEDIYFDTYYDAVEIVLYDDLGYLIFDQYVPNHRTVTVTDRSFIIRSDGSAQSKVQAKLK